MNNSKKTRQSLLLSAIALLLSVSMLTGTTLAWFTDSATSGKNVIQSGTLEMAFEKWDGDSWEDVNNQQIFNYSNWEPGYTQIVNLRLVNEGTLALKWETAIKASAELSKLADVINVYVKNDSADTVKDYIAQNVTRDNLDELTEAGILAKYTVREFVNNVKALNSGSLNAGEASYLGLILQMDKDAGNEYQGLDLCGEFDIVVLATQYTYEEDSFDNQYDADATVTKVIRNDIDLDESFGESGYYELGNNISTDGATLADDKDVVLDLKEMTITTPNYIMIEGDAEIKNGTVNSSTTIYPLRTTETGTTVYENVNVVSKGGGVNAYGEIVFKSGSVTTKNNSGSGRHVFYAASTGKITVLDGTFKLDTAKKGSYLYADGGEIIVKGGTFDKPSTKSGHFPIVAARGGTVTIYGGTFRFDPSDFVADGYEAVKNGEWYTVSAIQ